MVAALLIFFVGFRCINLLGLPLYLDEGLYIYWAWLFKTNSSFAYVSLSDGKTPLFMWLVAGVEPIFHNLLLAGRMVSVFFGAVTALSWFLILKKFTNVQTGLLFLVFFTLTPYSLLVERMAFVDSMLTGLGSLGLVLLVYATHKKALLLAVLSGVSLGLAYMTKTAATLFVIEQLMVGALLTVEQLLHKKLKTGLLMIICLAVVFVSYQQTANFMRVGGHRSWPMIAIKETQITYSAADIVKNITQVQDFSNYLKNAPLLGQYIVMYLGVLFILAVFGAVLIIQKDRKMIWLVVYTIGLYLGIFVFSKLLASRYFYPVVPPTVALASIGAYALWQTKHQFIKPLFATIVALLLLQDILMVLSPTHALYAYDDQGYFVITELSAPGIQQMVKIIANQKDQSIVGISGTWGVTEGTIALLQEQGIDAVPLKNWWEKDEEGAYQLKMPTLTESSKAHKYVYLAGNKEGLKVLQDLDRAHILLEIQRPLSDQKVYFIELK